MPDKDNFCVKNIEKVFCICYNAGRQKDKEYFHCGTMNEPPDVLVVHPGVLPLLRRSHPFGLVTDYLSPSNHLMT